VVIPDHGEVWQMTAALLTESYAEQVTVWPKVGRHILAQYEEETIIVYQAYPPSIGRHAVEHGAFGGDFNYARMSWVKPNFLWMMYRSTWGTSEGQEVTLALRLRRVFFDSLLAESVPSTWDRHRFATERDWSRALRQSAVRLQWDRIMTHRVPGWNTGRSSWGFVARYWNRSDDGSWSRSRTYRHS
jgi:hypothetical protein